MYDLHIFIGTLHPDAGPLAYKDPILCTWQRCQRDAAIAVTERSVHLRHITLTLEEFTDPFIPNGPVLIDQHSITFFSLILHETFQKHKRPSCLSFP